MKKLLNSLIFLLTLSMQGASLFALDAKVCSVIDKAAKGKIPKRIDEVTTLTSIECVPSGRASVVRYTYTVDSGGVGDYITQAAITSDKRRVVKSICNEPIASQLLKSAAIENLYYFDHGQYIGLSRITRSDCLSR